MKMYLELIIVIRLNKELESSNKKEPKNKIFKRKMRSFVHSSDKKLLNNTEGVSYLKVRDPITTIKPMENSMNELKFKDTRINQILSQTFSDSLYNLTQLKDNDDLVMSAKNITVQHQMLTINYEPQIQNLIRKRMKLSTFANEESRNSHHNLSVKCIKIIDKENEKILSGTIDNREMDHCFSPMVSGFHPKTLFSTKGSTKESKFDKTKPDSDSNKLFIERRQRDQFRISKKPLSNQIQKRFARRKESSNSQAFQSAVLGSKVPILKSKPSRRSSAFCVHHK